MDRLTVFADWHLADDERAELATWPSAVTTIVGGPRMPQAERAQILPTIDVLVGHPEAVTAQVLRSATRLRAVHLIGHGVDGLLRDSIPEILEERGIALATASGADVAISEFAIMAMIVLARNILPAHIALAHAGEWRKKRGVELSGATLCLVGFGAIGQAITARASAMGMNVVVATQTPERHSVLPPGVSEMVGYPELDRLLARADFVVVAAPLTPTTRGLINADQLAAMKPGGYLVNVGRGPLVDERAFYDALESGQLAGAAIDPWWCEESGRKHGYPAARPIHQYNVLMTPHFSAATWGTRLRVIEHVGDNLSRLSEGIPLQNEVSVSALRSMID